MVIDPVSLGNRSLRNTKKMMSKDIDRSLLRLLVDNLGNFNVGTISACCINLYYKL